MRKGPAVRVLFLGLVCLSFVLSGCAGLDYNVLGKHLANDECAKATSYVEQNQEKYGPNRKLLFLMDAGTVNLYCGKYQDSNRYFHEADQLAEDLWTKSLTKEGTAFLVNDYTIPYAGEDFEKALINAFSAINYTMMGNYDEALVECRRLNSKLELLNSKYEEASVYKEDAFGRYLSASIYEAQDMKSLANLDSAFIDLNRSVNVFKTYHADYGTPMPRIVKEDFLRIAEAVGRLDEAKRTLGNQANTKWTSHKEAAKMGKVVLLHMNGRSPVKESEDIIAPSDSGPIKISFPKYRVTEPACSQSTLIVESPEKTYRAQAELAEDINEIAVKNLEDRKGRVILKTIARAVVKQVAINEASKEVKDKEMRELTKFGLNVINTAVERADTRTWRTLPAEILMSRIFVPTGEYAVSVTRCDGSKLFIDTVRVEAGKTKFVLLETIY